MSTNRIKQTTSETSPQNIQSMLLHLTKWVSSQMEYSLSGFNYNIQREGIANYKSVEDQPEIHAIYNAIDEAMESFNYLLMFQLMLDNKIGDCTHQDILLGMILQKIEIIKKNYTIFQAHIDDAPIHHTFLMLVPREAMKKNLQILDRMQATIDGQFLLDNKDNIIILDPWQNTVNTDLSLENNPLTFQTTMTLTDANFLLQNFDYVYKKLQTEFHRFYPVLMKLTHDDADTNKIFMQLDSAAPTCAPKQISHISNKGYQNAHTLNFYLTNNMFSFYSEPSQNESKSTPEEDIKTALRNSDLLKSCLDKGLISFEDLVDLQKNKPWVVGALRYRNINQAVISHHISIEQLSKLSREQMGFIEGTNYTRDQLRVKVDDFLTVPNVPSGRVEFKRG